MKRSMLAAVTALLLLFPWQSAVRGDAVSYTVDNLGPIDGLVPAVTGINASGQVSGYVNASSGSRAVRYTDGVGWTYLSGLGFGSVATGINTHGDLSGYYQTPTGTHAFRYRDGTGLEDIAPLKLGSASLGMAINADGDVVGYGDTPGGLRGWRASPGFPAVQLPTLGGTFAMTCGINSSGQIAGTSTTADGYQHAYRINTDGSTNDAGSFDGPTGMSNACAIDDAGHIGGYALGSGVFHAFRFLAPDLVNVEGSLDSIFGNVEALAAGASAGWFISAADGASHALLHTAANGAVDLGTLIPAGSGWVLFEAKGINASGQIVGDGLFNGAPGVFRLTPTAADHTAPVFTSLSASPSSIVPPNNAMVPVTIAATASDDKDPSPVCTVTAIGAHGPSQPDSSITGPLEASVRAVGGATYTLTVTCRDATGNAASENIDVVVPPDTTAPVFTSVTATPSTIWPPKGQTVNVTVAIAATDDSGAAPVCKLGNVTGPGTAPLDYNVTGALTGTVRAIGGRTYAFNTICGDGSGNYSWSSVNVLVPPDTTAPVVHGVTATPSTIWPPNDGLVPVTVAVAATDDVDDAPVCRLTGVTSTAESAADYSITGALSAQVRATGGRTYTLRATCFDAAGNHSDGSVDVVVPADTTAPAIASLSASPAFVWPPNQKMVDVEISVSATDDVDVAPRCTLASISGGDAVITGAFTARVRSEKGLVYSLNVSCSDRAGNISHGVATVTIGKDPAAKSNNGKR